MKSTAVGTALSSRLFSEIVVDGGEKLAESGIAQQRIPHWGSPPGVRM